MIEAPPNGQPRLSLVEQGDERVLQKGYLPVGVNAVTTNVGVHLNRFPLGDIDNFSVSRYAYALAQKRYFHQSNALTKYAPWETQYYQALDALQYKAQGDYVSIQDGGALAPEAWSRDWSELLRAFSALDQLPVTKFQVPYRILHLAKVSSDVTISYPGENVSIPATQFQFGLVSYTARKASATAPVSNELIRDAAGLADQVLRQSTARAIAYDRDFQALLGQGGPQPTGLLTQANAGIISKYYPDGAAGTPTFTISGTANHNTPSFAQVSLLRGKVHQLNNSPNAPATGQAHCNGMIVHSRFEQTVLTQSTTGKFWTDNNGRPLWMSGLSNSATRKDEDHASDGALLGQIWVLTNILPTNSTDGGGTASSFIIAGWWEQYAVFEALQVGFDTTMEASYYQNDQTGIRVLARGDTSPIHPEAFAVMAGVDP